MAQALVSELGTRHVVVDSHLTTVVEARHVAASATGSASTTTRARPARLEAALMRSGAVVPIAETTRSGVVESVHFGAVVALDADGMIAWSAGDPDTEVYPRSALKPLQAQAMVDAGFAAEPTSSPSPPPATAASRSTSRPSAASWPTSVSTRAPSATPRRCRSPRPSLPRCSAPAGGPAPLLQNCSGKHAAMLSTSVANGWDVDGYLDFDHPVQKLIDAYIAEAAGGVSPHRHRRVRGRRRRW